MNIQKVKEALEAAKAELTELSSAPNGKEPKAIRAARLVAEALAELENPVDDDASAIALSFYNGHALPAESAKQFALAIQAQSESYHAKKCAECTQKKAPYKLFGYL